MKFRQKSTSRINFLQEKKHVSILKIGGILIVILAVSTTAFVLFKKDKSLPKAGIETVYASEMPDWWNLKYFGHSVCTSELCKPEKDLDGDHLNNAQEFYYHTDPYNPYTVGDQMNDGELVAHNFDPSKPGRITFEEAVSDDGVLEEGLLFDKDIKKMVAESQDMSKVYLPIPSSLELKITNDNNPESYKKYFDDVQNRVSKVFSKSDMQNIISTMQSGGDKSDSIKAQASLLAGDLKNVSVPVKLLAFHKYTIGFYELLGEVAVGSDESNVNDPQWYDKAQAFFVIQGKLAAEKDLLTRELGQ
ncbi:MAG: hypothetical protein KW788_04015 [Candidatus Doudnabacteria bacterium]|nr:hypothetical protein [Candidatus Doudnabacteria bacterium]